MHIHSASDPLPPRPSQNTGQSSLCHTVGPCQLFILCIAMCICQPQSSSPSLPTLTPATISLLAPSLTLFLFCRQVRQVSTLLGCRIIKKKVTKKLKKIPLCLFYECIIYECRWLHRDRQLRFLRMERQEILWRGKENEEHCRPGCTTQISLQVPATGHIGRQRLCSIFGSTLVFILRPCFHLATPWQRLSTAEEPGWVISAQRKTPLTDNPWSRHPHQPGWGFLRKTLQSGVLPSSSFFFFLSPFTDVKPDHNFKDLPAFSRSFLLYPLQ